MIVLNLTKCFKAAVLFSLAFILFTVCNAQSPHKPLIDTSIYNKWPIITDPLISPNGLYVSYIVKNDPVGSWTLIIRSIHEDWELKVPGGEKLCFTNNEGFAVFSRSNDSLFIVRLGKSVLEGMADIKSFELKGDGDNEVLIMNKGNDSLSTLQLLNFSTKRTISFLNIKNYVISSDAKSLILFRDSILEGRVIQSLDWLKLEQGERFNIWTGSSKSFQMIIDDTGNQIAFLVGDSVEKEDSRICLYYKLGNKASEILFDDRDGSTLVSEHVAYLLKFSKDGTRIFFGTEYSATKSVFSPIYTGVKVWSYLDTKLQSVQEKSISQSKTVVHSFNISNRQASVISNEGDIVIDNFKNDKAAFIWHMNPNADFREHSWNKAARLSYFFTSTIDGKRIDLSKIGNYQGEVSPDAQFVIFFDGKDYYSYEAASGEYRNISKGINLDWLNHETSDRDSSTRGIGGWLRKDAGLLVYDKYDIWLLDPTGKEPAKNITNGYGRENDIVFSLGLSEYSNVPISKNASLILSATGLVSKDNGFFRKDLNSNEDPKVLSYGPFVFHIMDNIYVRQNGHFPIKARKSNTYMVCRMSATKSLNYFITYDFKSFTPVSHIYPERSYNWYTNEICTWRTSEGETLQGILYKPENFDSTKKYPLIINYYEKLSQNLNVCLIPNYSTAVIDIPTYVSNGYLVFTPDILYRIGDPMQGAYNSITSATHYLSTFQFVNKERIGIQGFSFGGVQTNYLVANTSLFAAACSASGLSDFISAYGSISVNGYSLQGNFESGGQVRMGGAPWEIPDLYIKNSPIFKADRVSTPLLMMHTTGDGICPFSQALEFFTALRRLNKRVWLLEYIDGRHTIRGASGVDFDMRMRQFFDHYLKNLPAPDWMTKGRP
ncbi:dienelactone hydrolase [Chitinophaga sp. W3I9]|uniref:alpha/beta hydrolase family protein n=1 Tax=Chitinophaga sp. W3I9 TaxID=3373924 RepID=UPI003D239945